MPHFTVDWFSHNIPTWERVFNSLGWLNSEKHFKALEVGSWEGQSACWLLQHVCRSSASTLTCIDTWAGAQQYGDNAIQWGLTGQQHEGQQVLQRFNSNVADIRASDRVTIRQEASCLALAKLMCTPKTFDVVYIDGSHDASDVLTDAVMAWKLLAQGGIMILDDYEWHVVTKLPRQQTPQVAIDAFLDIFSEELDVLVLAYQCIVQKHKKRSSSSQGC